MPFIVAIESAGEQPRGRMTKHQISMTKQAPSTKDQNGAGSAGSFGFSNLFGHWSLVIGHAGRRDAYPTGLLLMRVPTFSPFTARRMFPSLRKLNTRIGMLCSMQWAIAVLSITRRFRSRTVL